MPIFREKSPNVAVPQDSYRVPLNIKKTPKFGGFLILRYSFVDSLLTIDYFVLLYSAVLMPSNAPIKVHTAALVFAISLEYGQPQIALHDT